MELVSKLLDQFGGWEFIRIVVGIVGCFAGGDGRRAFEGVKDELNCWKRRKWVEHQKRMEEREREKEMEEEEEDAKSGREEVVERVKGERGDVGGSANVDKKESVGLEMEKKVAVDEGEYKSRAVRRTPKARTFTSRTASEFKDRKRSERKLSSSRSARSVRSVSPPKERKEEHSESDDREKDVGNTIPERRVPDKSSSTERNRDRPLPKQRSSPRVRDVIDVGSTIEDVTLSASNAESSSISRLAKPVKFTSARKLPETASPASVRDINSEPNRSDAVLPTSTAASTASNYSSRTSSAPDVRASFSSRDYNKATLPSTIERKGSLPSVHTRTSSADTPIIRQPAMPPTRTPVIRRPIPVRAKSSASRLNSAAPTPCTSKTNSGSESNRKDALQPASVRKKTPSWTPSKDVISPEASKVSASFLKNAEKMSVMERAKALAHSVEKAPRYCPLKQRPEHDVEELMTNTEFQYKPERVVKKPVEEAVLPKSDKVQANFADPNAKSVNALTKALQGYIDEQPKFRPAQKLR